MEWYYYSSTETQEDKAPSVYKDTFGGNKAYFFNRKEWVDKLIDTKDMTVEELEELFQKEKISFSTAMRPIETKDGTRRVIQCLETYGDKTTTKIDNGYYNIGYTDEYGWFLYEQEMSSGDKFIELGDHLKEIRTSVNSFYDKKSIYDKYNLKHKKGVLLYGPAGTGKTQIIRELVKEYINDCVIIFVDTQFPSQLIKNLKHFKHNYIFIFEEFTQLLTSEDSIGRLLLFLDGELSLDNQLVIATTNYPEVLPANLVSRPGRFDDLIELKDPDDETRKIYLEALGVEVTDEIIKETKGFSIAYLKEIFLSSKVSGSTIMEQIKANKARMKLIKKNFASKTESIGLV